MNSAENVIKEQETRTTDESELLSDKTRFDFEEGLKELRRLEPRIEEIRRRFQNLVKELGKDGQPQTIEGYRTYKSWCLGVLGRPAKVVALLLHGGPEPKEIVEKTEGIRSLSFLKKEQENLKILFQIREKILGRALTPKEQKEFLHEEFDKFLSAYTKEKP